MSEPAEYPWPIVREFSPDEWTQMTDAEKHERADLLVAMADARRNPDYGVGLTLAQRESKYWKDLADKEAPQ